MSTVFGKKSEHFFNFFNLFADAAVAKHGQTCYTVLMEQLISLAAYAGRTICVALSGGRDSVCLLHLCLSAREEYGLNLSALHCNHGIRREAAEEERFVRELCAEWGIPLTVRSADVPALSRANGRGLEEEGRAFRYRCFEELLKSGVEFVATAHHLDDVAETLLFRLARGTSLAGMRGISEYGGIIRPLLSLSRGQIDGYVREHALPYVEDGSNADITFARNRIRHTVLPALEEVCAGAAEHIVAFARRAGEDDDFLQSLAAQSLVREGETVCMPCALPRVLFARACVQAMKELGVGHGYTEANLREAYRLRDLQSGRRACLPCGLEAVRRGGEIIFCRPQTVATDILPWALGEQLLGGFTVISEHVTVRERGALCADREKFPEGCVLRTRREGDIFTPYGGKQRTLKKFFTDKKIAAREGRMLPLIACGTRVLVVCGVEIADEVKITEETERIVAVRLIKKTESPPPR